MTRLGRRCFALALSLALASPVLALSNEAAAAPSVPEGLVPPKLVAPVTVEYPPDLAELDDPPRGKVVVKFTIGTDGVTKAIEVEQSVHPQLDALAKDAVRRLRYEPARVLGKAVEITSRIAMDFAPPEPEPEPKPKPEAEPEQEAEAEPESESESESEPASSRVIADGPLRISGRVLEAGQRTPIAGASIVIIPAPATAAVGNVKKADYSAQRAPDWQVQATTDTDGKFEVRGIPDGKARVIVLAAGFDRLELVEAVEKGKAIEVKYFVLRAADNPFHTVVEVENQREEVARRTITVAEINALPGTQGDALKAVQNFPGVARSPFSIGFLVVRGTGPNDSAIYLGHHEIPQLFHFGGLTSVFNSDMIERIDFIPGNYDVRYGDTIGGIIDVTPRAGRRDGYHGYIDSDLFDTGVLVEGPIGKGSFALSGRRSYIDVLLPVFIPDDAGLDLTIAPRYYDYQALFDYPVSGGMLSVRGFGSDDRATLTAANPNEIETDDRDRFESKQLFHRADIAYEKKLGGWSFLVTPSYRYEQFDLGISDLLDIDVKSHNLDGRAEFRRTIGKRSAIRVGAQYRSYWFDLFVDAPPLPDSNGGSFSDRFRIGVKGFTAIPSVFSTVEIGVSDDFTLYPGVRATYYSQPFDTATFDPRLRFGWSLGDRTTLKGGTGLYSQAPQPVEASEAFGNPRIGPERALQNSIGVIQEFDYGIDLDATVFFNWMYHNVGPSTEVVRAQNGSIVPENFANTQTGRVYGLELLARKQLTGRVFGWIAYTLSRSERRDAPGEEIVLFDFDQTHILTLIGVVKLPKNWQVGARFRLVSGNPNTPIIGAAYDADFGTYIPIEGKRNSDRFPAFHQLDLRVDKKWVWKRTSLGLYLDVQNAYNAQNVEFWNYAYDYTTRVIIASLPIIPSLGFKFAW